MAELPVKQLMYVVFPDGVHDVRIASRGVPVGYVFPPGQKPKDPYIVVDQNTGQTYVVDMKELWASPVHAAARWAELWDGEVLGEEDRLREMRAENPLEEEDLDICAECEHSVDDHDEDGCTIDSCGCEEAYEDAEEEE